METFKEAKKRKFFNATDKNSTKILEVLAVPHSCIPYASSRQIVTREPYAPF